MNILIVGSGGREHAIARSVKNSPLTKRLVVAPGNPGIANLAECKKIEVDDIQGICKLAKNIKADLVIIGPEIPLVKGLKNKLNEIGIKAFGPTAEAAMIEGSKTFSRNFCKKYKIPQPRFNYFTDLNLAYSEIDKLNGFCVVKADGLASGKGVFVCDNKQEAKLACKEMLNEKKFGASGLKILIEERITGKEASVFVVSDGKDFKIIGTAQDHKRAFDNDDGPNTGGMGAISPAPSLDDSTFKKIITDIIQPTINGMALEKKKYEGILYAGVMITKYGPKLIEFNCRFGDPEAQVILPLLETDIVEIMIKSISNNLKDIDINFGTKKAITVVLASKGYPGQFKKDIILPDIPSYKDSNNLIIYHSGTKLNKNDELVSNGGRVLCITSISNTVSNCRENAYNFIKKLNCPKLFYRTDIGKL